MNWRDEWVETNPTRLTWLAVFKWCKPYLTLCTFKHTEYITATVTKLFCSPSLSVSQKVASNSSSPTHFYLSQPTCLLRSLTLCHSVTMHAGVQKHTHFSPTTYTQFYFHWHLALDRCSHCSLYLQHLKWVIPGDLASRIHPCGRWQS